MKQKESNKIEFKKSTAELKQALEDICAFANTGEGTLYFGIDDDGSVVGQKISDDTIKKVSTRIASLIAPRIFPNIEVESIHNKDILKVEIKSTPDQPYQYKGVYYKRMGTSNQRLSSAEVEQMLFDKQNAKYRFDQLYVDDFHGGINKTVFNWFVETSREERNLEIDEENDVNDILDKLDLVKDGLMTNAGLLAFGNKIHRYYPNAKVKCAVFGGVDKTYPILDTRIIESNIFEHVAGSQQFFLQKTRRTSFVDPVTARRQWEYEWPLLALREAVANAVAHRDYRIASDIDILLFDDRLEISSPGGLPQGMTLSKLNKPHRSYQRNSLIAKLLYWVGYAETFGTGIQKMNNLLQQAGRPLPVYEEVDGEFVITFYKTAAGVNAGVNAGESAGVKLSNLQEQMIKNIKENSYITQEMLAEKHKKDIRTIQRNIAKLKENKIIKRVGTDKEGHWKVLG